MIQQAKFTFSPLGKLFEKQIKTIEDQIEKQIKALEVNQKQLVESNASVEKEGKSIPFDKQKEIFCNLVAGRTEEIEKST